MAPCLPGSRAPTLVVHQPGRHGGLHDNHLVPRMTKLCEQLWKVATLWQGEREKEMLGASQAPAREARASSPLDYASRCRCSCISAPGGRWCPSVNAWASAHWWAWAREWVWA